MDEKIKMAVAALESGIKNTEEKCTCHDEPEELCAYCFGFAQINKALNLLRSLPPSDQPTDAETAEALAWAQESLKGMCFNSDNKRVYNTIISALQRKPAIPEWQKIETAPRDRFILVCCEYELGDKSDYESGISVVWAEEKGWAVATDDDAGIIYINGEPIHWLPLPAAPKPDESEAG